MSFTPQEETVDEDWAELMAVELESSQAEIEALRLADEAEDHAYLGYLGENYGRTHWDG
jgi:hypothetical protein